MNTQEQKRLLMDLDISMRTVDCFYTVTFYGALFREVLTWGVPGDTWGSGVALEAPNWPQTPLCSPAQLFTSLGFPGNSLSAAFSPSRRVTCGSAWSSWTPP